MSVFLNFIGIALYGWGFLAASFAVGMDVLSGVFKNRIIAVIHVVLAVILAENLFAKVGENELYEKEAYFLEIEDRIKNQATHSATILKEKGIDVQEYTNQLVEKQLAKVGEEYAGFIPDTPNQNMVYYDKRLGSEVSRVDTSIFQKVIFWITKIFWVGFAIYAWNWLVDKTGAFWLQAFGMFVYAAKRGSGGDPVNSAIGTAESMFFAKVLVPGIGVILLFSLVFLESRENNERDIIASVHNGESGNIEGAPAIIESLSTEYSTVEAYDKDGVRYDKVKGVRALTTLSNSNIKGALVYNELICGWKDNQGDIKLRTRTPLFPSDAHGGEVNHIPPRWQAEAYSEFNFDGFIEAFQGTISKDYAPDCLLDKSTYQLSVLNTNDYGMKGDFKPDASRMILVNNSGEFVREVEIICQYKKPVDGQLIDTPPSNKEYEISAKYKTIYFTQKLMKPGATHVEDNLPYRHCEVNGIETIDLSG